MNKCIIYCRKSTDREDRQIQSLTDQRKWCEEIAQNLGYDVVEVISESISGKNPETRPGFKKMLKMLKDGKADRIITWKANRLARNPIDQSYIEWYVQEWVIREILSSDGSFRTGDNVLILRMHFGMATQFSIDLKKDTIRGMRSKVENGGIVAKPPRGYSIEWGEAVPDLEARVIKDIFDLRSQGWGMPDISKEMYDRHRFQTSSGKPVTHSYIAKIVSNPFYYGVIQWAGELFSWRHEPIISKEVWEKVNGIQRWTSYEKHDENAYFWLRGKVLDADTGAILTASFIKKKYVYFHTPSRSERKIYFNQQGIIDWFDANIHLFVVPDKLRGPVKSLFSDMLKWKQKDTWDMRKALQKKEVEITRRKQSLLKLRVDEEITQEEFLEEKNRLVNELQEIKMSLVSADELDDNILTSIDTLMVFCTNLVQYWKEADLPLKIDIIKLLVGNLFIDEKNTLTFKFYPLWEATYEVNKNPHKYGGSWECYLWLPNVVRCSDSPLSKMIAWFIQESERIYEYDAVSVRCSNH